MFRYVIFDILLSSRKFPLFRTRFAEFKTFFLSCTFLHLSFSDILQYPFSSKQDEQRHVAESFRKKDSPNSHIISPARPWRCNKPSEFTGELWERRCKHKTQEYPMYSPAYCTRRPLGFGRARSRRWTNGTRERERDTHRFERYTR